MNRLISSGDEKMTSARSPIMPAATRAGAPPLWPVVADVRLEAQVAFPEIASFSIRRGDLVRIATLIDRLHTILGVEIRECVEISVGTNRSASTEPSHRSSCNSTK
jgi:hypothetical protein